MKSRATPRVAARQSGLTLIELMIAITIGLLIIAGLTATFVNSSRTRDEVERSNQRIENGRYAMQVLADDLRMAGFLGEFNLTSLATPAAKPDPCSTALADLKTALPLHIQGYDNPTAATIAGLACLNDVKPGTDILVVRRTSGCVPGTANCAAVPVTNAPHFQASLCNTELALASTEWYRLDTSTGNLNRTRKNCTTTAVIRQYFTRIYFIAGNGNPGDGIPTLKRAELGAGGFAIVAIAEGIENLQLEYGIDTDSDGIPNVTNADPDTYLGCAGQACVDNWRNVMSVKVNLLARNITATGGFTDSKTYSLGLNADGSANTVAGAGSYKRHLFQAETRLNNPAGRR